jgi:xylan 1,4-beta-xylosidase
MFKNLSNAPLVPDFEAQQTALVHPLTSRELCPFPLLASLIAISFVPHLTSAQTGNDSQTETITIDSSAPAHAFPHMWEGMFGSGRAVLTLRQSYRDDLKAVKSITSFQYLRFHAIFHDENGVYDEDGNGKPAYNFSYVDQIYDGLLKRA